MNKISATMTLLLLLVTMGVNADSSVEDKKIEPAQAAVEPETKEAKAVNTECEAPAWAKAIGHEEKWKLHNGCKGQ